MSHRNAPLTETGRLRLARCIVEDGWPRPPGRRAVPGLPHHRGPVGGPLPAAGRGRDGRPVQPPAPQPAPSCRCGPSGGSSSCGSAGGWARPGSPSGLGLNPSTVHRVLARYGCPRLAHLDRATGPGPPLRARPARRADPRRRQETRQHPRRRRPPHRRRSQGKKNKLATTDRPHATASPVLGYSYLHTALDDHSRLAYTEILADERKDTATAFLHRAARLVRQPRHHHRARPVRQRFLLPLPRLGRRLHPARHHPQAHPPLPAPDQRQSRTLPPHPRRRMGLRPALRHRNPAPRRLASLAPHLQQSPRTHRTRRPPTGVCQLNGVTDLGC